MNFFKSAASAVSAAATMAAASAKKQYEDLKAPPTTVRCTACPTEVDVPPTAFDWHCAAGHVNKRTDTLCHECKVAQPANLPEPTVTCPSCQAVTSVPATNAAKHARESVVRTKEFAAQTAAATKAGVEHLRATPTTFHCAHCDTLLAVPTGPWACQTCTTENAEDGKVCKQCGQRKSDQKAICAICRQSTVIPSSNFADGFKHTTKHLAKGTRKAYFDVAGKPYLTCGKCAAHVPVPAGSVSNVHGASPKAAAAAAADPSAAASGVEGAAAGSDLTAAPGGAIQKEGTYNGESIICPACKNPVTGEN